MKFEDQSIKNIQLFEFNTMNEDTIDALMFMCNCIIIIYDKSSYASYLKAQKVYSTISICKHSDYTLNVIFIENKTDIESMSNIDEKEQENYISLITDNDNHIHIERFTLSLKTKENLYSIKKCILKHYSNSIFPILPKQKISPCLLSNDESYNVFKIILLGDSTVGKTSFYNRFFLNEFTNNFTSTIGINETSKFIKINKKLFKIQLWDTAGQERFRSIPKQYYSKADGIILLYDITKEDTFESIAKWVSDIKDATDDNLKIYLVGNKLDLNEQRKVPKNTAKRVANEGNMKFCEVSCKWDLNVSEVTYDIIYDMYHENYKEKAKLNDSIDINEESNKRKCC